MGRGRERSKVKSGNVIASGDPPMCVLYYRVIDTSLFYSGPVHKLNISRSSKTVIANITCGAKSSALSTNSLNSIAKTLSAKRKRFF